MSHVIPNECLTVSFFVARIFNIHGGGVLTSLVLGAAWKVPRETAAVSAQVLCTPFSHVFGQLVTVTTSVRRPSIKAPHLWQVKARFIFHCCFVQRRHRSSDSFRVFRHEFVSDVSSNFVLFCFCLRVCRDKVLRFVNIFYDLLLLFSMPCLVVQTWQLLFGPFARQIVCDVLTGWNCSGVAGNSESHI